MMGSRDLNKYLGIDVGGTEIKYALVAENWTITNKSKVSTPNNRDSFISTLEKIIDEVQEQILGIGLSFPGRVNNSTGELLTAGAIKELEGENIIEILSAFTDLEVKVENDAKCVAMAEMVYGSCTDVSDFICITVGTGIGGGIVIDRKLLRGHSYSAGEIGYCHNSLDSEIPFSGTGGIFAQRYIYAQRNQLSLEDVTGEMAMADEEIYQNVIRNIAHFIMNSIYMLNPEKIIIGGSISSDRKFIENIQKAVNELEIIPGVEYKVEAATNRNDAGIIGSVYNFIIKE